MQPVLFEEEKVTEKVLFGTEQRIGSRNIVLFHFLEAFTLANMPLSALKNSTLRSYLAAS